MILTCSASLLAPGCCCFGTCTSWAVTAVIYNDLIEHARCALHDHDPEVAASKPLAWSSLWGPR